MHVGMQGRERERKYACGHAGEREGERERMHMGMQGRERERESVCMWACRGERERERAYACGHAGERERKSVFMWACRGKRERGEALWLLLLYVFSSPWPALCKLGLARSVLFVLPEVFTQVLGPSLTFLCSGLMGFSLPCLLDTTIFDYSPLF